MNNQQIALNDVFVQTKGNLVSNMDGEKVMMSIDTGKYYNLGSIGGRIWELLETPMSVESLIATLTSEYDIDAASCENHVVMFLQQLSKENLIQSGEGVKVNS
ncbi:lasso peptide biosynthesis PqqD family chaperone [Paenibacillus solisilvae]|uniref:Lasso peptide biosynthesis PqqD family chaperone n=1 Tax=Paenibacillus solisilvae TaxID=2486751 RepID=A0ABW0W8Q5_9BACL